MTQPYITSTLCSNSSDLLDSAKIHFNPLWISTGSTPASNSLLIVVIFEVQTSILCTGNPTATFIIKMRVSVIYRLLFRVCDAVIIHF